MKNYVTMLKQEVDKSLLGISSNAEMSMLKKASEVTILLEKVFKKLRSFILEYEFKDETEEILFFKEIKPKFFCDLIFYRKVYNMEINRPTGGDSELKIYLENKLYRLKNFFEKNTSFYRYYRSGETCRDRQYFMREHIDNSVCMESFYYERDPKFSTCCDFKLAKVMANEKMEVYILEELAKIDERYAKGNSLQLPKVRLSWTASKVFLIEIIYALFAAKVFNNGKATLKEIIDYFECVFNIDLGANPSRTFTDLRTRKNRTSFLDKLRDLLNDKMDETDE